VKAGRIEPAVAAAQDLKKLRLCNFNPFFIE
jgi:hypothetical protein